MARAKPSVLMFAGPNGSGKSTVTPRFLERFDFPIRYINPDEIAATLDGNTMENAYRASAIAARERLDCINSKQSFSFETVMSHPSKLAILETAKEAGFETQIVFVSTNNPLINVGRVKQRVIEGGHDVPEDKIISRYYRSLSLLPKVSEIADRTLVFGNDDSLRLEMVLAQGKIIEKSENTVKWVENVIGILEARQQEKLAIARQNNNSVVAALNRSEHTGEIKAIGKHFTLQQTRDGRTIIHENSILNLTESAVGHEVSIDYRDGVHNISMPELAIDTSRTIDNILFELASSAKYLVLNEGTEELNSSSIQVYSLPSGMKIGRCIPAG